MKKSDINCPGINFEYPKCLNLNFEVQYSYRIQSAIRDEAILSRHPQEQLQKKVADAQTSNRMEAGLAGSVPLKLRRNI